MEREWYLQQTLEQGWGRNILIHRIESKLHARQVSQIKSHNFEQTLPSPQSESVEQALKDPYVLDFLTLKQGAKERDLQNAILAKLRDFLVELGNGFALPDQCDDAREGNSARMNDSSECTATGAAVPREEQE